MINLKNLSGMPQMSAAFAGWTSKINLIKVSQEIVDGLVEISELTISFQGTVQPLSAEQIMLKPEGQRSWQWLQIHCITSGKGDLKTGDKIRYNNQEYKVMAKLDYSLNNYIEYHAIEEYAENN